jgi:hypothetical protein
MRGVSGKPEELLLSEEKLYSMELISSSDGHL